MAVVHSVKYKESHIFAVFFPVLTTLCILDFKVLERFCAFFLSANNHGEMYQSHVLPTADC